MLISKVNRKNEEQWLVEVVIYVSECVINLTLIIKLILWLIKNDTFKIILNIHFN